MTMFPDYEEDLTLIKNRFIETTRNGKHLNSVIIALKPKYLMITQSHDQTNHLTEDFYYPLETTKITVFKTSRRQSIKVSFNSDNVKYFELDCWKKRKIFWKIWCFHVCELNRKPLIWPFVHFDNNVRFEKDNLKTKNRLTWTNKYLYLGTRRAIEDNERPKPVPGLGPTEDIKLLYLKPKYFGCWDQSEHWVQCGNSWTSIKN